MLCWPNRKTGEGWKRKEHGCGTAELCASQELVQTVDMVIQIFAMLQMSFISNGISVTHDLIIRECGSKVLSRLAGWSHSGDERTGIF